MQRAKMDEESAARRAAPAHPPMRDPELRPDRPPAPIETGNDAKPRRARGFAAMDPSLAKEIARKGGMAAHSAGKAHEFTPEEARIAGRKGGLAAQKKRLLQVHEDRQRDPHPSRMTVVDPENDVHGLQTLPKSPATGGTQGK
jgi:general stress protein YciG